MFGEEEQEQYQPQGYQYQPCNQNTQELRIIYLMANILVNLSIIPFPPVKMHVPMCSTKQNFIKICKHAIPRI